MNIYDFKFSDVNWGSDIADGDYGLGNYFVEYPGFSEVLTGDYRYIIGRKGAGKSAILQRIKILSEEKQNIFCVPISLKNFPINEFRSMGDPRYRDKSKYVSAWKFLIEIELAKLITSDCSVENNTAKDQLSEFLNRNLLDGVGMVDTITTLKEKSNKISVLLNWISGDFSNKNSEQRTASVHYQLAENALEKLLYSINSGSKYYILSDDLDEGYKDNDSNLKLVILSLLRANEEIALFFQSSRVNCFPIAALRSDIFDNLADNDLNKLDDYILRLNWSIDEDGQQSIKRIVENRMMYSFKCKYPEEKTKTSIVWNTIFDEGSASKGLWKYISIHTFDRPRDVIKMLKYCQKQNTCITQLSLEDVKNIEIKYSGWLYREFRDEVQSFLPCWKSILNCLTEISYGKEKISRLKEVLESNNEILNWMQENKKDTSYIVQTLFNYSVIGCINDKGRWLFKYKDLDLELMPSYVYYCVHYGFSKKLRIVNSYGEQALTEVYYRNN